VRSVPRWCVSSAVGSATIFRAGRWFLGLFPNLGKNPDAGFEVVWRDVFYKFVSQPMSGVEYFLQDSFRAALEMNDFATPIVGGGLPLNPTSVLKAIKQTGQGWLFNAHAFSDLFLSELVSSLGKVDKRSPFALT